MPVHALQIQYRFLCSRRPNDADHVFSFLGALLSSRRFPGSSILSCCSYSVVGAYRLIETGEGPLDSISVGFPGSVFPIQSRGDSVRRDRRIGSQPQGDGAAGLYKSVPEQIVSVMTARLPPPPFLLSFSPTAVRAGRLRPLFCGLFSPARAARTGVRTPLGTVPSVPAENCSQPGQC